MRRCVLKGTLREGNQWATYLDELSVMKKPLVLQWFNKVSLLMRSCGALYLSLPSAKCQVPSFRNDEYICSRHKPYSLEPVFRKLHLLSYVLPNRLRHQTANVLDDLWSVGIFGCGVESSEIGDWRCESVSNWVRDLCIEIIEYRGFCIAESVNMYHKKKKW